MNEKFKIDRIVDQLQHTRFDKVSNVTKMDDIYYNLRTGQGTLQDSSEFSTIKPFKVYSFLQLETLMAMDPLINKVISTITRSLYQNDFEIECEENTDYNKKFKQLWRRYGLEELMQDGSRSGYVMGHSFLLLDTNDSDSTENPLDITKVTKIKRINMLNRSFLAPDPTERDFSFDPIFYYLVQEPLYGFNLNSESDKIRFAEYVQKLKRAKIHYTRMLPFWGTKLDPFLFRANLHFHDSYIRKIENATRNYNIVMSNLSTLMSKVPIAVASIDNLYNVLTNPEQRDSLKEAMAFRETMRSTNNVSVLDTKETYELYSPNLGGFDAVVKAIRDRVCEQSDIPHDLLFGEGSTGQTTGRTEKANYERFIQAERRSKIVPKIEFFMRLFQFSDKLAMPEDYEIKFEHTEQLTDLEESTVALNYANAAVALSNIGYDTEEFITSKYKNIKADPTFSELEDATNESI